ncbi:hypothetical protein JZ751_021706 [Albula glossodonta]|uniref:Uncharacterized protein n=1 Tax=Albula glossodonta TaxID=121402 RepID=A0A8T2NHZ9_9TELE|nr:hypothetical protein JZ751_021706 [Albula glossodonta]
MSEKDGLKSHMSRLHDYTKMYSYENRLQTFTDWPFLEDCKCTPEQVNGLLPHVDDLMAKAGFIHCPSENEPDVACCFFCLKELEGWEPSDNPWSEHIKRSPNCGFLVLKKDLGELTVKEYHKLEQERLCICIRKAGVQIMADFRDEVDRTRKNLQTLFSSGEPGQLANAKKN